MVYLKAGLLGQNAMFVSTAIKATGFQIKQNGISSWISFLWHASPWAIDWLQDNAWMILNKFRFARDSFIHFTFFQHDNRLL